MPSSRVRSRIATVHMRMPFVMFLAITALASAAAPINDDASASFYPFQAASALSLSGFSAANPAPLEGQDVYFTAVVTNTGNVVADARARVCISDSADSLVDCFNYSDFSIGNSETLTLIRAWSTAGRHPGGYAAFANVSYNGTVTNTLFATFSIGPAPPPAHVTVAPGVTVEVLPGPPDIALPRPADGLLRYPILKEVRPGENALIFPLLENSGPAAIYVNVTPGGPSAALASEVGSVLLPPLKPTSLIVPIRVPQSAPAGYYELSLNYSLNGSVVSQPLVIRVVPPAAGLTVYREISIDRRQNSSVVQLDVMNWGTQSLGHAEVFEQVPPAFDPYGLSFSIPPSAFSGRLVRWDLANVLPNETRVLSYALDGIPGDTGVFTLWPQFQTVVIEPNFYRDVSLGGFDVPDIAPGEKGACTLQLFNSGPSERVIAVKITGPEGWAVEPDAFTVSIPSRNETGVAFSLTAPQDAPDPVYTFTAHLTYDTILDQKALPVPVDHEKVVTIPPSSLRAQLLAWLVRNAGLLAAAAFAAAALLLALRRGYAELRKPRYNRERVDSLLKMQKMFGSDERGDQGPPGL